jgi:hypothetical protein
MSSNRKRSKSRSKKGGFKGTNGSFSRSKSRKTQKEGRRERSSLLIGNSPTFYKRLRSLSPRSRVPKKFEGENPAHHSDLFTDENPIGTVHGLKIKNKEEATQSVNKLKQLLKQKKITYAHASQITNTLIQRAKHHYHQTSGIKEGGKVWQSFKAKELSKFK